MRDLIILGSMVGDGTHSAEMAEIVERINAVRPTWNLLGYIVAEGASQVTNGYPVLGGPPAISKHREAAFVSMAGRPPTDRVPPERLVSLIDPSVFLSRTAKIGRGVVIFPHCYIGLNAQLSDYCFLLAGSVVNHDVVLERAVTLAAGVTLGGSVTVGPGTYLGQACTVREKISIAGDCLIGMGAVVTKDVPANTVMVGNPARKLRSRR
jgi:sugar O-acyltransferase (sialic acid O-acetyltransferase NeuD family)